MAISDRINEMYTHVGDVYDTITNVDLPTNKNIQNIPNTMRSSYLEIMNNGIDKIWNNWEKVEGTGETITLNNTEEAPMKIDLKGNTSQEGTPTPESPQDIHVVSGDNSINVCGKNLYNGLYTAKKYINYNTGEMRNSDDWSATDYIEIEPNTNYTLSGITNSGWVAGTSFYDNNKTFISSVFSTIYSFTTPANAKYLRFSMNSETPTNVMLEKGSTATTFEPYKSQSYSVNLGNIELCKIGDYQDSIKKSTGKNLFDKNTITSGYRLDGSGIANGSASNEFTSDFIEVESGKTYIRNYGDISAYTRTCFYDKNKSFVSKNDDSQSFTIPDNVKYIRFSEYLSRLDTMQFEKGTTATTYEPYGKVWYLNKQTGKVVLNGSESWSKGSSRPFYTLLINDVLRLQSAGNNATLFCNYLSPSTPATIWGNNINGITNLDDSNAIRIRIQDDPYTITTFKEWLNDVKPVVYYVLATPTYTEITDSTLISQLEALNGAKSYTTQTNISQENNDKPFILDVTALKQLT